MKQVIQLDANGYFLGVTSADVSPLEPDLYLMPANTVDADVPVIPDGHKAKWDGAWVSEAIPEQVAEPAPTEAELDAALSEELRGERDALLKREVDPIAGNALRWNPLDADTKSAWGVYRQALLDIPQQSGFPNNIVWPVKPEQEAT